MKNSFFFPIYFFLFLFLFSNCSKDITPNNITSDTKNFEVQFFMNFFNNPTSTKTSTDCPTNEYLEELAYENGLYINLTINNIVHKSRITRTKDNYISHAILLEAGDYTITEATITTSDNEILFSAVNKGSKYEKYVPSLLPIKISIGDNGSHNHKLPLYEKSPIDIYVLCVADRMPADFGFLKWNVHYTKLYCIPFIINHRDATGEDFVASGTIRVKNGQYNENTGIFTQAQENSEEFKNWAYIDDTQIITSGEKLTNLYFADNYDIDNQIEYYQITLNLTFPINKTIIGYANVVMLEQYNNIENKVWNAENNFIHFDFSKGNTWFFPSD